MRFWLRTHWKRIALAFAVAGVVVLYLSCAKSLWKYNPMFDPDVPKSYDQTFYIASARAITTHEPGLLPRSRMPLYPWLMHFFCDPAKADLDQLTGYIRLNVAVSVFCLFGIFFMLRKPLGSWFSALTTLIVAFRVFVFKAVIVQPELLFYTLYAGLFLLMMHLLKHSGSRLMAAAGLLAGVTHLTKGSALPMCGIFLAAAFVSEIIRWRRGGRAMNLLRPLAFVGCFLLVAGAFLRNSYRAYGSPFYDPNTRYYFWAESPREMMALQHLGLPNGKPRFDNNDANDPIVEQFLPKWCPDASLRDEIISRARHGELVFLEGRYDILPTARKWWAEHSPTDAVKRVVQGVVGGNDDDPEDDPAESARKRRHQQEKREYRLLYVPAVGVGDCLLGHNRDHPNGYWDFLRFFFVGAVVSGGLALVFSWRSVMEGLRANWLSVLFASSTIVITALAYAWWGEISIRNRYFLSLYLPLLIAFAQIIRFCCSLVPVQLTVIWHRRTFFLNPITLFLIVLTVFVAYDLNDPLNRRNLASPRDIKRQLVQ